MAVKYLRLFDPTQQFQLKGGQLDVAGRLYVHYEATDDLADLYDENGTQLSQPVILDNNGRAAGLFVDSSKVYWLDVQDQYGMSQFTVRKMTPCGGGGGSMLGTTYEIVSSDGSIAIDKVTEGNVTTFDITRPDDSTELLEWIRCDGATNNSGTYTPIYTAGTMQVGTTGIQVYADRYYHVTAHLRATKSDVEAYYDNIYVLFSLGDTPVTRQSVIVDYSMGLSQDFEVSTDIMCDADAELNLSVIGDDFNCGEISLLNMSVHRVFSGVPVIPGGVQKTLIPGANITIEHTENGDIISSDGAVYTAGTGIVVDNTDHTISVANNVVIDNSYVHTDNNFSDADASKLAGIESGAEANVQSDWEETDVSADSYIQHKPSVKPVVAGNNITITETSESFTISATAAPQLQSNWNDSDPTSVQFIQNKPTIPDITIGTVII